MFLGIFSSILPYLIAAGFYLAWILFSFVQPYFQKSSEVPEATDVKEIVVDTVNANTDQPENFDYTDYDRNEYGGTDYTFIGGFSHSPPQQKIEYLIFPPERDYSSFLLSALSIRPPPAC